MVAGVRQAGLSISRTDDLLRFAAESSVGYTDNCVKKKKTFQLVEVLWVIMSCDCRGQRQMVQANRKVTVTPITDPKHQGKLKISSGHTTC